MDLTDKNFSPKKLPDRKKRLAKGCTTLMYSCQQGKSDNIVTELRIKPKSVYRRDKSNKSALHYCCGQLDLVAAASITTAAPDLLESADEDGLTPLHLAVIQGNMALVNLLLANKANVNAVDNEGHSVVHWAAVCGEVDALRALLAAGADITKTDLNGGSPLHYAAQMSNGSSTYQSHSANLALEILEIFLQQPNIQVDVCDKDGRQPLLWAASAGAAEAVLLLVKAGARVESADKDGLTALHCAASRGHTECINVLINLCGAPIDLIDSNGCTALHYAVTLGHADATYMLLDLAADPNRQDRKGRTPAHCGCAKGQFETVKMLRDRKANMWLRNAKGDLPLHEAAASGRRELVLWLLDQRPKHVNTTSNDGRTILHIAAANDYTDMCKMLIDFGADINSIHRLPGNVVQTPLDSALSKGHRSTAKFLQLHGGLPANKLRLSGRNPNALNDQELVKPLTFSGDKKRTNDMENLKKTRSVWLYVDQSDSDANETDVKQSEKLADGSSHNNGTREKRKSRKPCGCHYHYYHHYRHRCRVRSNSCERIEILERDGGPDSAICRSKSNVEICLYHKRKPKYRRDVSSKSASTGSSCSEDESCNSERMHQSARHKRENHRSKEKSKSVPGKEPHEKAKDIQKIPTNDQNKNDKKVRATKANVKKIGGADNKSDGNQANSDAQKEVKAAKSGDKALEQSVHILKEVEKAKDTEAIAAKDEVASSDKVNQNAAERANNAVVTVVADVHNSSDVTESAQRTEPTATQASSVDKAKQNDSNKENAMADTQLATNTESAPKEATSDAKGDVAKAEESVERIEKHNSQEKLPTNENKTEAKEETKNATKEKTNENVTPVKSDSQEMPKESALNVDTKATSGESTVETKEVEIVKDKKEDAQAQQNATSTVANESEPTNDTSKSFQVLPIKNQISDKQINQEQDDTENLLPSKPTQTIRKTSFTVLKSDESIDDLMAGLEENVTNESDNGKKEKPLSRPKSFKVLNAHDASGEDIILHQSSDQETAGNEKDDDYMNDIEGQRSGKYSDSELMKMDGQLNGRRKKYKKRAKSLKQLTIMDRSQQSKDQDSGFEPSPRTIRSQRMSTTRTIYTASLPERPRVGDIVDGRSMSSRYEQRKPGDKNAVNMSTVSQTLQRNIRRYYMEHKIFQHLLELKSLQIRSSKMNESLLVKRAVDDYHKSTNELGSETGGTMRRYPYKEYTFKNFEIFLYEVLKSLQKNGSNNFQNISDVYLEAERRLSPDYSRCKKALYCTSKTHRCLHAAHAYTGIPCAAYIPMMNHHTMPKYGFGKTSMGSFYLPKICNKGSGIGSTGKCTSGNNAHNTVSLELSHGNNKQLITLPAEKLDNNKRYYVTFTLKENEQQSAIGNVPNGSSASELKK